MIPGQGAALELSGVGNCMPAGEHCHHKDAGILAKSHSRRDGSAR